MADPSVVPLLFTALSLAVVTFFHSCFFSATFCTIKMCCNCALGLELAKIQNKM